MSDQKRCQIWFLTPFLAFFWPGYDMNVSERYHGKPFLRLLECYVLRAIGELSEDDESNLNSMLPKLREIYRVNGAWYEIVCVSDGVPGFARPENRSNMGNTIASSLRLMAKTSTLRTSLRCFGSEKGVRNRIRMSSFLVRLQIRAANNHRGILDCVFPTMVAHFAAHVL